MSAELLPADFGICVVFKLITVVHLPSRTPQLTSFCMSCRRVSGPSVCPAYTGCRVVPVAMPFPCGHTPLDRATLWLPLPKSAVRYFLHLSCQFGRTFLAVTWSMGRLSLDIETGTFADESCVERHKTWGLLGFFFVYMIMNEPLVMSVDCVLFRHRPESACEAEP